MRTVFLCMVAVLLVSGCATQQADPQISKLKNQLAVIEMTYSGMDQQLADLKADVDAGKVEVAAQKTASAETLTGIKAIIEKAVRALDAKISALEDGVSKMKADIAAAAKAAGAAQAAAEKAAEKEAAAPVVEEAAAPAAE